VIRETDGLRLRAYRVGDVDAMVRLDELCFAPVFRFERRAMRQFAEARGAVVLVAEIADDGGSVGMAGFLIVHVEEARLGAANPYGYVVTIDVDPAARRLGVGKRMLRAAEERVREAGARWMDLHVATNNPGAIRFYEQDGYACVGSVEGFYQTGLDAYVYRKELGRMRAAAS
jgi:ribosomal-protein-alanine N-acetyltransferase